MFRNKINFTNLQFSKIFNRLLLLIPIGVLGNILVSFFSTDHKILSKLVDFAPGYFLLAILLAFVPWLTHYVRIQVWLNFIHKKVETRQVFKIVVGNDLGAALTPTAIGGGYIKIGMLMGNGLSAGHALSINTLGSLEDAIFFIIALPIAFSLSDAWNLPVVNKFIAQTNMSSLLHILGGILLFIVLIYMTFRISKSFNHKIKIPSQFQIITKLKSKLTSIWGDFQQIYKLIGHKGKLLLIFNIVLAGIQWTCRYSVITVLLLSLNIHVDPIQFFVLQWVVFSLLNLVPSPGAMGGAEAAFYLIYRTLVPANIIGIVIAGWRFLTFYMILGVAILIFYLLNFKLLETNNASTPTPAES